MTRFRYLDKNEFSSLPKGPGVYVFKKGKEIFYIGKASNIRERVRNHFQQPSFRDNLFISKVKKIGYLKTGSEIEALILEANLIKKYQPKFNILWRDDKNYFFVGVTKEEFPRVFITHQPLPGSGIRNQELGIRKKKIPNSLFITHNSKPKYVGPFVDGKALKQTLKVLRKVFPYRTCKKISKRPCLWYQLERCPAPCLLSSRTAQQIPRLEAKIEKESQQNAKNLIKIFQGKKSQVLKELEKEMKKASQNQEFERAAKLRDKIESLENILEHAKIFQGISQAIFQSWPEIEKKLRKILRIKKRIKRIEGYDISDIQGQRAAGVMVVFEEGAPAKKEYRRFKIKISGRPNDIAMIKEVLTRRLKHPEWTYPQIILIDGGKAQLNAAVSGIRNKELGIGVTALAKKKNELFIEGREKSLLLKDLPQEISNLILQIRDEAHRFAWRYHRKLTSIDLKINLSKMKK